jgi:crossover junction endodeoxyribonuclease RuvC
MVIIGVDPGSSATGYGIVKKNGTRSVHVASGVIRAPNRHAISKRLREIHDGLAEVVCLHRPSVMVVESLFHGNNSQSLMKLSQVRGVILLLGETHSMDIFEYAPREIKKGLTGYGNAEKDQVLFMVAKLLGLPDLRSLDEADARAAAIYHSHVCSFAEHS